MANKQTTFIQLPMDITNPIELRRFLDKLIQQIDAAFGNRGHNSFITNSNFLKEINTIQKLISALQEEAKTYIKADGSREFTEAVSYNSDKELSGNALVDANYVEGYAEPKFSKNSAFNKSFSGTGTSSNVSRSDHNHNSSYTKNPAQSAVSALNQAISDPPTQAEVQEVSDKVDAILGALRNANILQV